MKWFVEKQKVENIVIQLQNRDNRKHNEQPEFGGFKKGFLSKGLSDTKPSKTDSVPFLKANPKAKSDLVFKEVQDEIKKSWLVFYIDFYNLLF